MKWFEISMVVISTLGFCLLWGADVPTARADFTFGAPANLEAAVFFPNCNCFVNCFSSDSLEMFVDSNLDGGQGRFDLWVLKRASPEDGWGPPENLGLAVNSAGMDQCASISGDGLELYFHCDRPGGSGSGDIYVIQRATRTSAWGPATNLGPQVNSSSGELGTAVSSDGLELYFSSNRPGGYGYHDIYVGQRATTSDPWGAPMNLGPAVSSPAFEQCPCLSPDGLLLFFQTTLRSEGFGKTELWMTRRASHTAPWEPAVNLGPVINSPEADCRPCVAADGSALYFAWDWSDRTDIPWKAPIIPVLDFNGDAKLDAKDMALLIADWGKSNSVYDIGPFPWGDGIVDTYDLSVLLKETTGIGIALNPRSEGSEVAADALLSWTSVSFAQTCDVYLGTSEEAVKTASRTNPQGVLVGQGQTATTYDPPGPLEFSKTYYWRVDFVISSPTPAIYQGPVLKFTTEAYAHPIQNIIATASSSQTSMGPEKTVDGSGLDKNDGHSTNGPEMWLSRGTPPNWIHYQFDKVYTLYELWVWNSNQLVEPFIGFGAKTVKIEYSTDGTKWTPLANVPEFARAPGKPDYMHNTVVNFGGVQAKFVRLTIEKGWGATPSVGLSEVRFLCIQSAAVPKP